MDSLVVVIQVLAIAALVVLIVLLVIATYILIVFASKIREILEIISTVKLLTNRLKNLQTSLDMNFKNLGGSIINAIMNILTNLIYRK